MSRRGSIEILLLLCCLVGVVAFLCFALGVLNVGTALEQEELLNLPELTKERDDLEKELNQKEETLRRLKEKAEKLEKKIREKEQELAQMEGVDNERKRKEREEELRKLKEQAEKLEKKIREKEQELAGLRQPDNEIDRKKKEEELKSLKSELEELEKKIREKEQELAKLGYPGSVDDSLEKDIERLKKEIEAARKRMEDLRNRIAQKTADANTFNPWKDFKGTVFLRNPMFVECKKDVLILHPQERILPISELSRSNPFSSIGYDYDGIVFLVRPDGFDTFRQSFELAKKTNLKIAYEPVDSNWKLDFSKGGR